MSEQSPTATTPDARERFRGCLAGLVVGECLGAPLEGLSPSVIKRLHDRVTEIRGGGFLGLRRGEHGHASDAMFLVGDSVVATGRLDMDHVVASFLDWRGRASGTIDETTEAALERIERGTDWRSAGRKVAQSHAAGNAALSRVAPLALYLLSDRAALIQHAEEIAAATHAHPDAVGSSVATGVILAALAGGAAASDAVEEAVSTARARGESAVAGCLRGSSQKELRDLRASNYCLHTLETSAWCLETTASFEEAVINAVNLGGAAAVNGAVTGALAGACHGAGAIPDRWSRVVEAHARALDLAEALHRLQEPAPE